MANKFNSYIEKIDTEFIKEIFPYIGFVDTELLHIHFNLVSLQQTKYGIK